MMRLFVGVVAACLAFGAPRDASAADPSTSARSVPGWEAVGRLNISGRSMCTGSLIGSDLVLTAAHCLYDQNSGRAVHPSQIRFDAGLIGNRAKASRKVVQAAVHPGYRFRRVGQSQIGYDVAVLRLDRPISASQIRPFSLAPMPVRGDSVGVMSYNYVQANRPSLESPCYVLATKAQTMVMSCSVEFGASGAPVFDVRPGQAPRLVSVVSAKAAMGNRPVSIGTALDQNLQALIHQVSTSRHAGLGSY